MSLEPLDPPQAAGAAAMLCYLRDLIQCAGKQHYTREDLLVLFEMISTDAEIFPDNIGIEAWQQD